LANAGVIVKLSGDTDAFFVKPVRLLTELDRGIDGSNGTPPPLLYAAAEAELQEAVSQVNAKHTELEGAIRRAAHWRKVLWSGALLFCGAQLALISRLTFFDLDWDIMEPVSYFLGTGTSLVFFGWMLFHGQEHSYRRFDDTMLPKKLQHYAPKDFDWEAYEAAQERVRAARTEVSRLKLWMERH
jgi:hypothetical protein